MVLSLSLVIHSYYKSSYCICSFLNFYRHKRLFAIFANKVTRHAEHQRLQIFILNEKLKLMKISFMFQNVKSVILLKNKKTNLLHHFNSVILNVKVPQQQQNVYTICCGLFVRCFVGKINIYHFAS